MASWAGTAGTGLGIFAGTNIDDVLVLTVLFVSARSGRPRRWEIVTGQALGFTALLAASVIIAVVLGAVPKQWIRLLGLAPIGVGLWGLWQARHRPEDAEPPVPAGSAWAVAMLTIANGADNLSVYPPLLRTVGTGASVVIGAVFYVGLAVWCGAAALLSSHRAIATGLSRIQHWLAPAVFIGLGTTTLLGVL